MKLLKAHYPLPLEIDKSSRDTLYLNYWYGRRRLSRLVRIAGTATTTLVCKREDQILCIHVCYDVTKFENAYAISRGYRVTGADTVVYTKGAIRSLSCASGYVCAFRAKGGNRRERKKKNPVKPVKYILSARKT